MTVYTDFTLWAQNIPGVQLPKKRYSKRKCASQNIFITPIAKEYKKTGEPCSKRDWEEQIQRGKDNKQIMWDGPALNRTQPIPGDLMAIWFHQKGIHLYEIIQVLHPSSRLPTWSTNIGQSERHVVYLDNPIKISWDDWISMGGFKRCMGTTSFSETNQAKYTILEYWKSSRGIMNQKRK
jgi:hypothetical protein